jgi:MFS family permease
MINVKHLTRMLTNTILMIIGFLLIGLACTYDTHISSFYLSLFASVILGVVSALGESTTLGFCKGFPSTVVGYFGSGTGFAGVFGAGVVLLATSVLKISNIGNLFFAIIPTSIIYFLAFWWINRMKARHPYVIDKPNAEETFSYSPPKQMQLKMNLNDTQNTGEFYRDIDEELDEVS